MKKAELLLKVQSPDITSAFDAYLKAVNDEHLAGLVRAQDLSTTAQSHSPRSNRRRMPKTTRKPTCLRRTTTRIPSVSTRITPRASSMSPPPSPG